MPFDKVEYWKKRLVEKLESIFRQLDQDISDLGGLADHARLEKKNIDKATIELIKSFKNLDKAFREAKVKEK